eukprot:scaffold109936_cov69-Phaeocystis_antarctica.AAC.1
MPLSGRPSAAAREGRGREAAGGRRVGCDEVLVELELEAERLVEDEGHACLGLGLGLGLGLELGL